MKVWKIRFDSEAIALDEEYNVRDCTLLNSYVDGDTVYVEDGPSAETIMTDWYGDTAEIVYMDEERAMEMFHPN